MGEENLFRWTSQINLDMANAAGSTRCSPTIQKYLLYQVGAVGRAFGSVDFHFRKANRSVELLIVSGYINAPCLMSM